MANGYSRSPKLLKVALIQFSAPRLILIPNINTTRTRTLQIKAVSEAEDRSDALRLTGPPVETIKLDAEIDATDQPGFPNQKPQAAGLGDSFAARGAGNNRLSAQHPTSVQQQSGAGHGASPHAELRHFSRLELLA